MKNKHFLDAEIIGVRCPNAAIMMTKEKKKESSAKFCPPLPRRTSQDRILAPGFELGCPS
jgi:hypothetical protein